MADAGGLTEVARGVHVVHSSIFATTTTVVTDEHGRALVIDPGVTAAEMAHLADQIVARGWRVVAGFATHPHWDHLLWHPALGDGPRWARAATVAAARHRRAALIDEAIAALGRFSTPGREAFGRLTALPPDGVAVPGLARTITVIAHEAHAPGHAALHVPDAHVLIAGDLLSDVEIPLLDLGSADPVGAYRSALLRLESLLTSGRATLVIPGHGAIADTPEAARRLALDRTYLADLTAVGPAGDPRLTTAPPWLRAEHDMQRRRAIRGWAP